MRILHTSDWHLGRSLEGRSRLEEQVRFIDELCGIVEEEKVDLILVAGDVFDTVNPSAAAEELYYEALDRLAAGGSRAVVVIAGNHDNPERLCAAAPLALRYGITLLGLPKEILSSTPAYSDKVCRVAAGQGWAKIRIPNLTEMAVVAMLPYPSESRLNEILTQSLEETELRQEYSQRVRQLFTILAANFEADTVNLGVSHLYVRGGLESESERPIQLGGAPTVEADVLPSNAQYVALGHLHRPQEVKGAPILTRYSGSPLAYSFSESGYAKSVIVIEAFPGKPAVHKEIVLSSGYPLVKWQAKEGLAEVHSWIEQGRDLNAWIDLEIHLTKALNPQDIQVLRGLRERIINIRPVFPETKQLVAEARSKLPIDDLFRHFYKARTNGAEPDQELVELFLSLLDPQENNEVQGNEEVEIA
ncbi:MAG: exonuclease SbcCD subunit D [Desulfitobacteriaceae bacterium]